VSFEHLDTVSVCLIAIQAVYDLGPLIVGMSAGNDLSDIGGGFVSGRGNGLCNVTANGKLDYNHAMMVVGYKDTGNDSYFIIKNSWGTSWAVKGKCYV
jgi:hypothetical protein